MTSIERNRQAAVLIWSCLIVATVLLLSRRVAGGIDGVESAWPCLLVSLLATVLSGFGWLLFRQRVAVHSRRAEHIGALVAWLPTWLSGLALLPTDSPLARGWLVGIAALYGVGIAMSFTGTSHSSGTEWHALTIGKGMNSPRLDDHALPDGPDVPPGIHPDIGVQATVPSAELAVFEPASIERSDESTRQWMTRQSLPDGTDQIEGAIRVLFAAGQKLASVHVPFSPPFAATPQVECELDGTDPARWKLSVAYAYGMRIELKRESSDGPGEVALSYSAVCESAAEAA
jgi:hypothetical protein